MHKRRALSVKEAEAIWGEWRDGASPAAIGQTVGRSVESVYTVVYRRGGIAPAARVRAWWALSAGDREEISRGVAAGASGRAIARALGRAPSTISREIRRHAGRTQYRAAHADAEAWQWAARPKRCRLAAHARLCAVVATQLRARWSPQQIAGWLVTEYPDDPTMRVSHETIYRSLYLQARGVLKKELVEHLRRRHRLRRRRNAVRTGQAREGIIDAVSIAERPAAIEDRAIPGHWEGDLLAGAKNSHIATLVERHSRYLLLVRVAGKDTTSVVAALIRQVQQLPAGLMASLTWDRGMEMAQHARFTIATDVQVYFCDPKSPWQRGSNENTNGLLRQYFPHGTDLQHFSQRELDAVALSLNTRPRQTLGFRTPAATLAASVALTG